MTWPLVYTTIAALVLGGLLTFFTLRSDTGATLQQSMLVLESDAFEDGGLIPRQYSCEGDGISPGIAIDGAPAGTKSLALIVHDPDVPKALKADGSFDHWIVFNIPPDVDKIPEGGPVPGVEGSNGAGKAGYTPPCPPTQYEPKEHRYIFTLYALDDELNLAAGATRAAVEQAMQGHILAQAQLLGRYQSQGK